MLHSVPFLGDDEGAEPLSVVLLVGSQSQLSLGMPWLNAFAATTGDRPDLLVLGEEHQTLLLRCESTLRAISATGQVASVEANAEQVIDQLRKCDCRLLVMVDDVDDDRLEEEVFESCGIKSVWLNGKAPPPESNSHIFAMDESSQVVTSRISRRLLGMMPTLELEREGLFRKPNLEESSETISDKALRLERQRCDVGDLLWVPFGSSPSTEEHYEVGRALLTKATNATVALVSLKESWDRSMLARVRYWASHVAEPMDREARLELARTLSEGSQPNLEFLGLISAAAMLAAFGLLQNSAAVIIGAMLIAPLMTPIMGAGLSLAHGNRPLFRTSILSIAIGFGGAFVSSFLFGLLVRLVHSPEVTSEMWGRCNPSPLDFCVGLVGGMAASYARTRSHLSSALAGAAIAAALVPPIATAGLQAAFGQWKETDQGWPVFGPLILVGVNVLTIMIGTAFVLYARGLRIESGSKWATRMTVSLTTLVMLVLVWMLHLETWFS